MDQSKEARIAALMAELAVLVREDEEVAEVIAKSAAAAPLRMAVQRTTKNLPYYRESFAKELAVFLDQRIANGKPIEFRKAGTNMSSRTLWYKVTQAWQYLRDNMDPDGKYAAQWEKDKVKRKANMGVVITTREYSDSPLQGVEVARENTEVDRINIQIMSFLQNADSKPMLDITAISLTDEQVNELSSILGPTLAIPTLAISITNTRIRILKKDKLKKDTEPTP